MPTSSTSSKHAGKQRELSLKEHRTHYESKYCNCMNQVQIMVLMAYQEPIGRASAEWKAEPKSLKPVSFKYIGLR